MDKGSAEPSEALQLYASIFEDHPLGYYLLDNEQVIIKANQAFAQLLGYEPAELIGKPMEYIVDPAHLQGQKDLAVQLHTGKINDLDLEGSYLGKSGDLVSCRSLIKAVFDVDGHLKYCVATVIDRRQAKEVEEDLRYSKSLWNTAYDNASFGIAFLDPFKMKFINANRAFVETVGYDLDELRQLSPLDISPIYQPDGHLSVDLAKKYIEATLRGESPRFDWLHKHKDHSDRYIIVHLDRIGTNENVGVLALAEDITDRKRQENSIRKSEERYRNLYHTNPLMLFTVSTDGRVLEVNEAASRQLGYSALEMLNQPIDLFFLPEDQPKMWAKLRDFLAGLADQSNWQLRKVTKNGDVIHVNEIIKRIDRSGQEALLIACENVTETVRAEKIRRQSEERYRTIFNSNFLGIAIMDPKGSFEMVNPAMCQMFGYKEIELLNMSFRDLTDPEDADIDLGQVLSKKDNKEALVIEKKYYRQDGSILFARTIAKLLREEEPQGKAMAMVWDITNEKKVLEQNREIASKTQELTAYMLFLTQKNELLRQMANDLTELTELAQPNVNQRLRRLIGRIEKDVNRENTWLQFQKHFKSANPNFLPNLKKEYPNLTLSEQRHCALVVMAMTNTEVANLLHVTPKAVEVARYRLKKKFELNDRNTKLSRFLQKFL